MFYYIFILLIVIIIFIYIFLNYFVNYKWWERIEIKNKKKELDFFYVYI
jgi:hypothetical protein